MSSDAHHERIKREFRRQADSFAEPRSFFGLPEISEWIGGRLPLTPASAVLDLAGGAGHLSRALAPRAARFVVLDITPDQLEIGREAAAREGIDNVEFVAGDAAATPFGDGEFDLVINRFALHHMTDPAAVVTEAGRVCRAGGHVALIDLVSPEGGLGRIYNELERLRDPSHTRGLLPSELDGLAAGVGTIVAADDRDHELLVEDWMERAHTPDSARREIRTRLRAELDGGEPTGMRPRESPDGLHFTQSWRLLLARVIAVPNAGISAGDDHHGRGRSGRGGP